MSTEPGTDNDGERIDRFSVPRYLKTAKALKWDVFQLSPNTVLKRGKAYFIRAEAEAMRFVSSRTSIPIPRLYDHWEEDGTGYILMEFKEGTILRKFWYTLTLEQRTHVMGILAGYVEQLRALPQPAPPPGSGLPNKGWIGSTLGHAFSDMLAHREQEPVGPFASEADFHDWRMTLYQELVNRHPPLGVQMAKIRSDYRDDDPIVFTHSDFSQLNILVRVNGGNPEDVEVTALLDWEQAGWRPVYWEGMKWRWMEPFKDDWRAFGEETLNVGYERMAELEDELLDLNGGCPP